MSKQTAVEWLEQQFNDTFYVAEFGEMGKRFTKIFEQAKAMEREQIGLPNCKQIDGISSITIIDPATGKVLGKGGEQ